MVAESSTSSTDGWRGKAGGFFEGVSSKSVELCPGAAVAEKEKEFLRESCGDIIDGDDGNPSSPA